MEKIVNTLEFTGKGITSLAVGDPSYLDAIDEGTANAGMKNLIFTHSVAKSMELNVRVSEIKDSFEMGEKEIPFTTIRAEIVGLKGSLPGGTKEQLLKTFREGCYHPSLVKTQRELGCDTARFIINTGTGFDEFHTGSDGYYGNIIWYAENNAFWLTLDFDGGLFTLKEIAERMMYLFNGKEKELLETLGTKEYEIER